MVLRRVASTSLPLMLVGCSVLAQLTDPRAIDEDAGAGAADSAATDAPTDAGGEGPPPSGDAGEGGATSFCSAHPQAVVCDDFTTLDLGAWTQAGNGLAIDGQRSVSAPSSLAATAISPGGGGPHLRRDVVTGAKRVRCSFSFAVGDLAGVTLIDVAALVVRAAGNRYSVRVRLSGSPKRMSLLTIRDGDTGGTSSAADLPAPAVGAWMRVEVTLDPSTSLATITSGTESASVAQSQIAVAEATEIFLGRYASLGQEGVTVNAWYDDVVCTVE